MAIEIVKLITGEEIVSDTFETGTINLVLKKPCIIQLVPSRENPGQTMMGLFPYAAYTESHEVEIAKASIVWRAKPVKELYNQYNSAFGSGIQLAGV